MKAIAIPLVLRRARVRRWVIAALLPVLLFAQWATAAYVCPQLSRASIASVSMPVDCDMSMGDSDQPALCQAHCVADSQASSAPDLMAVALPVSDTYPAWRALPPALTTHRAAARFAEPRSGPPLYLLLMVLRD